ncbi:WD repeat-containing protein 41-like [Dysidea avara]|uniref:WD repeat-containing protein 41-like n=1 Tax=Dysidea avara TaxID=196820 RepID=UPI003330139C
MFFGRRWRKTPVLHQSTDEYHEATSDQHPREVQILTGHSDIIRIITRLDDRRFITASDDTTAIVWNMETGSTECVLRGHDHPITCSLLLVPQTSIVLTGSSDKTIRVWDLSERVDGDRCIQVLREHQSAVKCLVKVDMDMFCSGGADICLWHKNGTLLSRHCRRENDPAIHTLLQVHGRHFCVIAAADYPSLAVYDVTKDPNTDKYKLEFAQFLARHREDIQCLTRVSESICASASLDGAIILWSTNSFSAVKQFNYIEDYQKRNFPDRVWQILVMEERYLFASVANGFKVFDVIASEDNQGCPKLLACYLNAHQLPITHMELIDNQSILVTCSSDNTIRLWGDPKSITSAEKDGTKHSAMDKFIGRRPKSNAHYPIIPNLLGELRGHTAPVLMVCNMSPHGLVTGGVDTSLLLWKDSERESNLRFQKVSSFLNSTTL